MTKQPTILAVMVNYNGNVLLKKSIPSVLAELDKLGGKLVVVDNASNDGSIEYMQDKFPQVKILQTGENLGGSGGFRTGMRYVLSKPSIQYIWLLDNDIVVDKDSLPPLIELLLKNQKAGAAGSQICIYDNPDTIQEVGAYYTPWLGALEQHGSGEKRSDSPPFEVDYLAACSLLIRRECLEQVGIFSDFFIFYDDVEWGLRAKMSGWQLFAVPASVIRHHYNMIKPVVPWREYYRKRNRLVVLASYPPRLGKWTAIFVYVFFINYSLMMCRLRGDRTFHRTLFLARNDAINGILGKRDLNSLNTCIKKSTQVPSFNGRIQVLIDIPESAGNALAATKSLIALYDKKRLVISIEQREYLKYFNIEGLELSHSEKLYDLVVIGKDCRYSSIHRGRYTYRFSQGDFLLLAYPKIDFIANIGRKVLAIIIAFVTAPFYGAKLIYRYRDSGKSTFLK